MSIVEMILISVGLAMDAFAVSVCKGLSMKKINIKKMFIIAFYFGLFQGGMPVIGYLLGVNFSELVSAVDHWIAFILLAFIGGKMIKESLENDSSCSNDDTSFKTMVVLAIATSIDALAVGITFAFLKVNVIKSSIIIAVITMLLTLLGVIIGNKFGKKYKHKAQFVGGFILIFIGIKIFIEHTIFL